MAVPNWVLEIPPGNIPVVNGDGLLVELKPTLNCGTIPASLKFRMRIKRALVPNLNTWLPFTQVRLSMTS